MRVEEVRGYYAGFGGREWERLIQPDGLIEFAVTTHALSAHLPARGRILDIGGGPGRYTIWLAQRGYRVVLADLSPDLLALAKIRVVEANVADLVEEVTVADACDLSSWPDNSFDAVVSLGPFYHLTSSADRMKAVTEMHRVLRSGEVAFVGLMPRYSFLRRTLAMKDEQLHLTQPDFLAPLLEKGIFRNDIVGRFTEGYGVVPDEVTPFFDRHGFTALSLLGCEGIAVGLENKVAELATSDPEAYRAILNIILHSANEPSILGLCNHLLYVGRKRDDKQVSSSTC